MKEHKIILNDLKKYLKRNGITTEVYLNSGTWEMELFEEKLTIGWYAIINDSIAMPFFDDSKFIVSLADPQYREKFYKYLKENECHTKSNN